MQHLFNALKTNWIFKLVVLLVVLSLSCLSLIHVRWPTYASPLISIKTYADLHLTPLEKYKIENNYRCEAEPLGCLKHKPKPAISVTSNSMNTNWCFVFCSYKKLNHAGLTKGNTCVCSKDVNEIASIIDSANCDLSCPQKPNESCGGAESVQTYRIITTCQTGQLPSPSYEDIHHIDHISNYDTVCVRDDTRKTNLSTSECILHCGANKHPLAFVNPKHSDCYCGRFDIEVDWTSCMKNWNKSSTQIYRTLAEDKKCKPISFLPINNQLKRAGIISFPGSGNTWIRHLIEQATGIYTGSAYHDREFYDTGFYGELLDVKAKQAFAIKDHLLGKACNYDTAILLIRNPYDAIRADYNFRKSHDHIGVVKDERLLAKEFEDDTLQRNRWDWLHKVLFGKGIPVHIVVFEDLVKDPIREIRAIMQFLEKENGFKPDDLERRLLCLNQNLRGNHKRKTISKLTNDKVYTKKLKERVNSSIRNVQKLLVERNISLDITSFLLM